MKATGNHRTVEGMAAAAERIGEELARAKTKIADSAAETGEDLAAELRQLQGDLNDIKTTLAGFGRTSRAEAGATASRIGGVASEAAGEFAGNARQDAQVVMSDLETFARQNPKFVLGGALGLGLVLGLMVRRH
jgi:ElaB/YqjD/DUF883 family membrane-anchored ribosome-binding protein